MGQVEAVAQLVGQAAVPFGQQLPFPGFLAQVLDVKGRIIQGKAITAHAVEGNAAGIVGAVLFIVPGRHDDQGVLAFFPVRIGLEKFVKLLRGLPAAAVFIRIVRRRVLGLVFNDVHAAGGFDVQAEGARAVAVPLHFPAVKLLKVKQQFAEAPFVIRNGFRVTAQKVNDVELLGRFFQGNPVFQNVWNGDPGRRYSGSRPEKGEGKKCGEKSFKHACLR